MPASRQRAGEDDGLMHDYAIGVITAADMWQCAARRTVAASQARLLTQPHEHVA